MWGRSWHAGCCPRRASLKPPSLQATARPQALASRALIKAAARATFRAQNKRHRTDGPLLPSKPSPQAPRRPLPPSPRPPPHLPQARHQLVPVQVVPSPLPLRLEHEALGGGDRLGDHGGGFGGRGVVQRPEAWGLGVEVLGIGRGWGCLRGGCLKGVERGSGQEGCGVRRPLTGCHQGRPAEGSGTMTRKAGTPPPRARAVADAHPRTAPAAPRRPPPRRSARPRPAPPAPAGPFSTPPAGRRRSGTLPRRSAR